MNTERRRSGARRETTWSILIRVSEPHNYYSR